MICGDALRDFAVNMNRGPEPDTIAFKAREGYKIKEVQVEMDDRIDGQSYLTILRSAKYIMTQCVSITFVQPFRKKTKKRGKR